MPLAAYRKLDVRTPCRAGSRGRKPSGHLRKVSARATALCALEVIPGAGMGPVPVMSACQMRPIAAQMKPAAEAPGRPGQPCAIPVSPITT